MTAEQAPLYVATYDLTRDVFARAARMPRQHRAVLARHLQEAAFDALVGVTLALQSRRGRAARLVEADIALTRLRLALRLARDGNALAQRSAAALAERLDDIGRQLGGWLRSLDDMVPSIP